MRIPATVPGIADVDLLLGAAVQTVGPVDLLIEVPHGATALDDYHRLAARLQGRLPDALHDFFLVNTDVAAPELGQAVAERFVRARPDARVLLVRARVPRTFVDVNRVLDLDPGALGAGGVTPGIPPFLDHPEDLATLHAVYRDYRGVVDAAWEALAPHGLAFTPHTYAPRTVGIERVDAGIVEALHAAWAPGTAETWPLRPEVDLITADPDGRVLGPEAAIATLVGGLGAAGVEVALNGSYTLHPATLAHTRATRFPGRVLCLEVRRDLLVRAWTPFAPMEADPAKVARFADPIAAALLAAAPTAPGA